MKRNQKSVGVVRRSVALPSSLVAEVVTSAPAGLKTNFNRLVVLALEEFVARRRLRAFADSMAEMAADPAIQQQLALISKEFQSADADGLTSKKPIK
jgi:hypothetical protein